LLLRLSVTKIPNSLNHYSSHSLATLVGTLAMLAFLIVTHTPGEPTSPCGNRQSPFAY